MIFSNIINLDTKNQADLLMSYRKSLLKVFMVIAIVGFCIFIVVHLFVSKEYKIAIFEVITTIVLIILLKLSNKQINFKNFSILVTLLMSIFCTYLFYYTKSQELSVVWGLFVPLMCIFLFGYKAGSVFAFLFCSGIIATGAYGIFAGWENWSVVSLIRLYTASVLYIFALAFTEYTLVSMQYQLNKLSLIDGLTGLFNRRKLEKVLEREVKNAEKNKKVFSVAVLNINNLKFINDKFGYKTGDDVLIILSKILSNTISQNDILGRWNGQDFIIALKNCNKSNAIMKVRHIKSIIEKYDKFPKINKITCCYGISTYQLNKFQSVERLIKDADMALYQAKSIEASGIKYFSSFE